VLPFRKPLPRHHPHDTQSNDVIEACKKIENIFKKPQDIEWCIQGTTFHVLQSRPITTMRAESYRASLYLDDTLPRDTQFLYEKTPLSEIAERPTPFTLSLLEEIYKKGGPVYSVYESFGVNYIPHNFLKIIGNELFVDREAELKTLLPAYTYFGLKELRPHAQGLSGLLKSLKNTGALGRISFENTHTLKEKLQKALTEPTDESAEFTDRLKSFLSDYQIIFEINVLAEKALSLLTKSVQGKSISVPLLLGADIGIPLISLKLETFEPKDLNGNSIEISDTDQFTNQLMESKPVKEISKWWYSLVDKERQNLTPIISHAKDYNRLREYGRWLTVKQVSVLREYLMHYADQVSLANKELIYFATLEEIKSNTVEVTILEERLGEYTSFLEFQFPPRITSKVNARKDEFPHGVSPGIAQGKLVDQKKVASVVGPVKYILHTSTLSPHLTKHFDRIQGILAEHGGVLSHLAIMARERGVPVIVNVYLKKDGVKLGDSVEIDGATGHITKINE